MDSYKILINEIEQLTKKKSLKKVNNQIQESAHIASTYFFLI